jgi:tripartite-type tricarboxylate transporter receptor subunit TctC
MIKSIAVIAGAVTALWIGPVGAQEPFPSRPITFVVPTAAGGGTDTVARLFAERLAKTLGKPVVVDNRPGANGIIGTEFVARAAPNGYTVLFTYAGAHVVNPGMYKKLPYDPVNSLAPVAQIARAGNMLMVRADLPVDSVQQLVEYVRARPGKLNYCSWGNGSGGHLTMESLKRQAKLDIAHVPYKGNAPCIQDLLAGQIDTAFGDVSSNMPHVRAGKLKVLVVSGPTRLPTLPNVPTMNEAGFPFKTYSWYGVFVPAGTPQEVVQRLNAEVNAALQDPAIVERFRTLNLDDLPITTPEQFSRTVRDDMTSWSALIRELNLVLE